MESQSSLHARLKIEAVKIRKWNFEIESQLNDKVHH